MVILIPPKLYRVISQDFADRIISQYFVQQQTNMMHSYNVYFQIIAEKPHIVLSANKNLWCIPSSEYYSSWAEVFHKTLFIVQQQIFMLHVYNVYLQTIKDTQQKVLSATQNLWCILSSEYSS